MSALEAFEAVARHGHVTRAAEELGRTQSAISRQVANLESFARRPLFVRLRKRLILTESGRWFADTVTRMLNQLETDAARLITFDAIDRQLRLGVLPTFSSRWLIPRLSSFPAAKFGIEVTLLTGYGQFDLNKEGLDAAIQVGRSEDPGMASHELLVEEIVAVCAPQLTQSGATNIHDLEWLHLVRQPWLWTIWLRAFPDISQELGSGLKIENITVAIDAACRGLGAVVLPTVYIAEELANGRLVAPFGNPILTGNAWHLIHHAIERPKVTAFRDWIVGQARGDTTLD